MHNIQHPQLTVTQALDILANSPPSIPVYTCAAFVTLLAGPANGAWVYSWLDMDEPYTPNWYIQLHKDESGIGGGWATPETVKQLIERNIGVQYA